MLGEVWFVFNSRPTILRKTPDISWPFSTWTDFQKLPGPPETRIRETSSRRCRYNMFKTCEKGPFRTAVSRFLPSSGTPLRFEICSIRQTSLIFLISGLCDGEWISDWPFAPPFEETKEYIRLTKCGVTRSRCERWASGVGQPFWLIHRFRKH